MYYLRLQFAAANRSLLSGRGLFPQKRPQEKAPDYDEEYVSMTPIVQNTEQNNVIRVTSMAQPNYTQGPIQHGRGMVNSSMLHLSTSLD